MGTNKRIRQIILSSFGTALLCIGSWIAIPFGVVPITMQTFFVFVLSFLFSFPYSFLSILLYLTLGILGLPVFACFSGGIGVLLGPSGGYLFGFLIIPLVVCITKRILKTNKWPIILSGAIGLLLCYTIGTIYFYFVYGGHRGLIEIIALCVLPYLLPDTIKIFLAFLVYNKLEPHYQKWIS